jgi:hypothetical protein
MIILLDSEKLENVNNKLAEISRILEYNQSNEFNHVATLNIPLMIKVIEKYLKEAHKGYINL